MLANKAFTIALAAAVVGLLATGAWAQEGEPKRTAAPAEVESEALSPQPSADQTQQEPPNENQEEEPPGKGDGHRGTMWLVLMIGGLILIYLWMGRGPRKERQRRQEMISSLKKGDKVTTIGGIVGTVIEIRDDELTVKVDESNNVRMKFAKWAVRGVGDLAKAENPAQAAKQSQQSGK